MTVKLGQRVFVTAYREMNGVEVDDPTQYAGFVTRVNDGENPNVSVLDDLTDPLEPKLMNPPDVLDSMMIPILSVARRGSAMDDPKLPAWEPAED